MQTCSFHCKWQIKHVNSIANVKIKSIANIFLCKQRHNVSGVFLHYFLHILNVYYEHFHVKFMYYSMANVKIKSIPNLFVCDHTRNVSIFFLFFFFAFIFFILEMFTMDIFMSHWSTVSNIYVKKTCFYILKYNLKIFLCIPSKMTNKFKIKTCF